jgi:major membrane immunogen (membrane-anchored lipoprotein)
MDILKVDAVTGATYSLYRFRIVAALALSEAKRGK